MEGSPVWLGLFCIFAGLLTKDIFLGTDAQKDVPEPKLSFMGPSIKFLYCYS